MEMAAPDGQVEVGELLAGEVGGGVDGGAVLVHGGEGAGQAVLLDGGGHGGLDFVAGRAVCPRRRSRYMCFFTEAAMAFLASSSLVSWLMTKVVEELARLVQGGALGARADAGVHAQHAVPLEGRLHQEVLEILGEHLDGVALGVVGGVGADLAQDGGREEAGQAVLDGLGVVIVVEPGLFLEDAGCALLVHGDGDVQGRPRARRG